MSLWLPPQVWGVSAWVLFLKVTACCCAPSPLFYSWKCDQVVPAGCLQCKQKESALYFLRLMLPFPVGFCQCTNSLILFFFFFPPAVHKATKTKWRRGERRVQWSSEKYALIILSAVVICRNVCFVSASVEPAIFFFPLIIWRKHVWLVIVIFNVCVYVYCELAVLPNPFGGVWTDCVFHLVKVFRLQIQRVGSDWNDLWSPGSVYWYRQVLMWRLGLKHSSTLQHSAARRPVFLHLYPWRTELIVQGDIKIALWFK